MEPFILNEQLIQLLRQIFGTQVELVEVKTGNQQPDYLVLLAHLRHPSLRIVIKLAGPDAQMAGSFDRTAMLHRLVAASTSIPMPEILAVDTSFKTWPWRYLIKTWIPGQEWAIVRQHMDDKALSDAYQQIGMAVAQLHSLQFPLFGELATDGTVIGNEQYLPVLVQRARTCIKGTRARDLFFSVLDKQQLLFRDIHQARLCHEDLHQHNILFRFRRGQWHLATILDFDKAWAGHNEIDLARMEFWRGMMRKEFWQPYEAVCPLDLRYHLRRPIYQLLWCLEVAWLSAEHIRDTQRLCMENGYPVPDRFV